MLFMGTVFFVAIFFPKQQATCFDGIRNQGESGVDCGGPCTILCRAQYANPTVLWTRSAKILSSGTYSIIAYAENPNVGAGAYNAPYSFKVYDKNNVLLAAKTGSAYIPPSKTFVVFADGINVFDKVPSRIDFQFLDGLVWQKVKESAEAVSVVSQTLTGETTKPKLSATIKNNTLSDLKNVQSIAIIYDENDNAIAFSRTMSDLIPKNSSDDIVFTWPEAFSAQSYRVEIVSEVLPQ